MKNQIKLIRCQQNLTQEQLAKNAGISRTALAMIENDKTTPDGRTIVALVRALKKPANEIFFELDVVYEQRERKRYETPKISAKSICDKA